MEKCKMWRCFLLAATCATAMAAATEAAADQPLSIEDLEELDDNLEELLSDEESKVVEKRWDQRPQRPSHHEYKAVAAATAHYGQHHHGEPPPPQHHQQQLHHHEVQETISQPS